MAEIETDCGADSLYWRNRSRTRVEKAREELVCPICFEMFTEPRTLACQHTFCTTCLQKLADASRPGRKRVVPSPKAAVSDANGAGYSVATAGDAVNSTEITISCPECRANVSLPKDGILGLTKNFKLEKIIEILSPSEREQLSRRKKASPLHCSKHSGKGTDYFCTTCNTLACGDCLLEQHLNHKGVKRANEVVAEHVQALKELIPAAKEILELGETSLDEMKSHSESLRSQGAETLQNIELYFNKIRGLLAQRESELKSEVTEQVEKGWAQSERSSLSLQNSVAEFHKCTEDLVQATQEGDNPAILAREKQLKEQLKVSQSKLESSCEAAYKLKSVSIKILPLEDKRLEVLCRTLASKAPVPIPRRKQEHSDVPSSNEKNPLLRNDSESSYYARTPEIAYQEIEEETETDEMIEGLVFPPLSLSPKPPLRRESHQYEINIIEPNMVWGPQLLSSLFSSSATGTVHPRGICCNVEGSIAITDTQNHCIRILASTGKCIGLFGKEGKGDGLFAEPTAITRDNDGNLLVCDLSSSKLQKFTSEGVFKSKLTNRLFRSNPLGEPWGITVNHSGTIFVSDWDKSCIHTYSETGRYLGNFGSSSTITSLKYPAGIAIDKRGRVIVADRGNHCVCTFMPDGTLLGKFGKEGHAPGELYFPFGIAVSKDASKIYVSESGNHRISVFNSQGNFLHCFGKRGDQQGMFHLPRHLCIDQENRLLVCDEQNQRIQVFTSY